MKMIFKMWKICQGKNEKWGRNIKLGEKKGGDQNLDDARMILKKEEITWNRVKILNKFYSSSKNREAFEDLLQMGGEVLKTAGKYTLKGSWCVIKGQKIYSSGPLKYI